LSNRSRVNKRKYKASREPISRWKTRV